MTTRQIFQLEADSLKRPPASVGAYQPQVENLKRKDFIDLMDISRKQLTGTDFMSTFASTCRSATPFLRFLTEALELDF